jgi:8-oxo-dGTP pyrophosphatase MutT (NUDIX family)
VSAEPRPAATVAILRDAPRGPEVLLTHRPATMAFGPGLHVFPGGALDRDDDDPRLAERLRPPLDGDPAGVHGPPFVVAAIREAWEEAGILLGTPAGTRGPVDASWRFPTAAEAGQVAFLDLVVEHDLELRGDWLVPLSRWVTPPVVPRRYDARFFVAWLPRGAQLVFDEREVVGHAWLRPADALAAMAAGRIELWMPTSATLQSLLAVASVDDLRGLAPAGPAAPPRSAVVGGSDGRVVEIRTGGAGGVPGAEGRTWVVGRDDPVVVDPGDPSDEAAEAILTAIRTLGGRARAVLVTSADPGVAAGGEGMALRLEVPLLGPFDAERLLAAEVSVVEIDDLVAAGDATLRVVAAADGRRDAVGYRIEGTGIVLGAERPPRAWTDRVR